MDEGDRRMTKSESGRWRIVYNNDGSPHVFLHPFPMAYEQLMIHLDPLAGLIDTFVYQMFSGNVFLHDTKIGEFYTGPYADKNDAGWHPNINPFDVTKNARRFIENGMDPMRVFCERAHTMGVKFFAGLRMNDLHDLWFKKWTCKMKQTHPELLIGNQGRSLKTSMTEWEICIADACRLAWNFAIPEVVKMRLDLLQETVEKYDLDGLELDFDRYPLLFPPGEEAKHAHILTDFIRKVRRMLDGKGKRINRPLELGLITPFSPQVCEEVGIQIHSWIAEGLVNYIAPRAVDQFLTETPFEDWKPLLLDSRTQLLGTTHEVGSKLEDEIFYSLASRCRQAGIDGVHLFNFNYWHPPGSEDSAALLKGLSDPQTTARHDKHYILACLKYTIGSCLDHFDVPFYLKDESRITFFLGDDFTIQPNRPAPSQVIIQLYTQGYEPESDAVVFIVNGRELPSSRIRHYEEEKMNLVKVGCWWAQPQRVFVTDLDTTGLPLQAGKNYFIIKLVKRAGNGADIVMRHFGVYIKYP